jgi:DNA repair exonuclease SbcCD ATPase subunit
MGAWEALRKLGRRRPLTRPRLGSQQRPLDRQELQRENKQLREETERLRQEVIESEKKVAESERRIADCEKQIADLERQLAGRQKDSTNSSKPPSSDGPAAARRLKPSRCRGRRKPGGQKGHPGRHRELQPPERVDHYSACGLAIGIATN